MLTDGTARSSTVTMILKTTTVAGLALVGSALISTVLGDDRSGKSHQHTVSWRAQIFDSLLDRPVWIGAAWVFARHHERRISSPNNIKSESLTWWRLLSDLAFVGLVMVLGSPKKNITGKLDDDSSDDRKATSISGSRNSPFDAPMTQGTLSERFFQRIEANLGLTPKVRNQVGAPNLDLSAGIFLPPDDVRSLASTIGQPRMSSTQPAVSTHQRYLELLVHNVSHTDLVLSLKAPDGLNISQESAYCLCRPRFSAFEAYSRRVLDALSCDGGRLERLLISFPRYQRSEAENRRMTSSGMTVDERGPSAALPIGFSLEGLSCGESFEEHLQVSPEERNDLRLRGKDNPRLESINQPSKLNAAFFPLLGTLLPQWQARLQEKYASMERNTEDKSLPAEERQLCKKVVILVSGVGSPRNWTHSMDGNSTKECAKLIELFIKTLYPEVTVVRVHSHTNIFRYDENIAFVQNELLPCVQSYRDAHATGLPYPDELRPPHDKEERVDHIAFDPDWDKSMSVTLSFADGSPARNHAIQAALRSYKPTYFHCWQLKTFWHEMKIVDSDIEVHSFEEMETLPPIDLTTPLSKQKFHQQQPIALQAVEEMKAFKMEIESILQKVDEEHDLRTFWMRKTRKPVLAVLAVQMTKNGPVKLYRGTNMEVSMPTGSLCAERNVIGTALADNPTLKRHHLKIIAVLSVQANRSDLAGSRSRPTSSTSLMSFAQSVAGSRRNSVDVEDAPSFTQGTRPPRPSRRNSSGEWLLQDIAPPDPPTKMQDTQSTTYSGEDGVPTESGTAFLVQKNTPARRISLYQHNPNASSESKDHNPGNVSKRKSVVVLQSPEDLNPLRPCGACNEWLKKISQSSPYFQILTFTDADCSGVYCTPVAE